MMGGNVSHEYMLLTPAGEDSIALCPHCSYRANLEAAPNVLPEPEKEQPQALTLVETPHMETIEQVSGYLHMDAAHTCKAVVYQKRSDGGYVVVFLRGDLAVNETQSSNCLGEELCPAQITGESGLCAGFLGPYGLQADAQVFYDQSLRGAANLCCGANRIGYHYTGLCIPRDLPEAQFFDLAKAVEGGICPQCGKEGLSISRGIEVGNIFQLGDKYTRSMGMQYLDENGALQYPVMGCYGIGIGRLAASICEVCRDERGPIWPISVAPWQVSLCCLRADNPPSAKRRTPSMNPCKSEGSKYFTTTGRSVPAPCSRMRICSGSQSAQWSARATWKKAVWSLPHGTAHSSRRSPLSGRQRRSVPWRTGCMNNSPPLPDKNRPGNPGLFS